MRPDRLRAVALIVVAAGAVGSVALTIGAGSNTPRLLLVAFVIWVLSPFVALAWANVRSQRWSGLTRATLYGVTLVLTLASLAIYGGLVKRPTGSANAFMFVVVPPLSLALLAIALGLAVQFSRQPSHREEEHR